MMRQESTLFYHIELLEPLVLSSASSITSDHRCLDFIPGRTLLGLVARAYDTFGEHTWDVFHAGKVRFSDALPGTHQRPYVPRPLTFQRAKGQRDKTIYNLASGHDPTTWTDASGAPVQLEAAGMGYVSVDGDALLAHSVPRRTHVKTAIEAGAQNRVEQSALFNYQAIEAGQRFYASVELDRSLDAEVAARVDALLTGTHRIGRSKAAQFGKIRVTRADHATTPERPSERTRHVVVALRSELALEPDTHGAPRATPTAADFGLPDEFTLDAAASVIRTRELDRFNGHRRSFDARVTVLTRGSTLRFTSANAHDVSPRQVRVGRMIAEGLGHVEVQPSWASIAQLQIKESARASTPSAEAAPPDQDLFDWLVARGQSISDSTRVEIDALSAAIADWSHRRGRKAPQPTQWSRVRRWARAAGFASNDRATLRRSFVQMVGGTTQTMSRGWEQPYKRSSSNDPMLGDRIIDFGIEHGGLALSELAHRVRARLTQLRDAEVSP